MIGFLVVSHGSFGYELVRSAELILGKQDNVYTLGFFHGDSIEKLKEDVREMLKKLDNCEGVLAFVDLLGGSPSNVIAMEFNNNEEIDTSKLQCISGVNLPMLIEAFNSRNDYTLEKLKDQCINSASEGIVDLRKRLEDSL